MNYIILLVGFVALIKGADLFISGSASVAKKFKIPDLVIGLTVVALGTSAPELAVSAISSVQGKNEMAISSIVGSNIFNLLVILGICSLIATVRLNKIILIKEFFYSILASLALLLMSSDVLLGSPAALPGNPVIAGNMLSRSEGIMLMISFGLYMYSILNYSVHSMKKKAKHQARADELKAEILERNAKIEEHVKRKAEMVNLKFGRAVAMSEQSTVDQNLNNANDNTSETTVQHSDGGNEEIVELATTRSTIFLVLGLIGVCGGGELVVDSASKIAAAFGLSPTLIGLTIVGIGTSLPELVTSVIATKKGNSSMALGNVIGSNVFNILFTLGFASIVSPIHVVNEAIIDTALLSLFTIVVFSIAYFKKKLSKLTSSLMLVTYAVYLVYICNR